MGIRHVVGNQTASGLRQAGRNESSRRNDRMVAQPSVSNLRRLSPPAASAERNSSAYINIEPIAEDFKAGSGIVRRMFRSDTRMRAARNPRLSSLPSLGYKSRTSL